MRPWRSSLYCTPLRCARRYGIPSCTRSIGRSWFQLGLSQVLAEAGIRLFLSHLPMYYYGAHRRHFLAGDAISGKGGIREPSGGTPERKTGVVLEQTAPAANVRPILPTW